MNISRKHSDSTYLSIIVAGRNDNYGGDFKERLHRSVFRTHDQLTVHKISSEIIFVNYNPLGEPEIEDFISWPKSNEFVTVRIITVPDELHAVLLENGKHKNVPLLEYSAKNTGIRRAKGEYILCMNPDIWLPGHFFANVHRLRKNAYYCADRIDFKNYINNKPQHYFTAFLKGHIYNYSNDNLLLYNVLKVENYFLCKWKLYSVYFAKVFDVLKWKVYFNNAEYRFHCNGSGDFTLMHRDNWFMLKGYNELNYISLHTDALMVIQAAAFGLKEEIIAVPVLHQEHQRRYDAKEENQDYREAYLFFQKEAQKMIAEKQPVLYNDNEWGLYKFDLEEKII